MKTTRRQELRTNELSEQLDLAAAYLKRNATALTIGAVAVLALSAAGYWYYSRQSTRSSEAWAQLTPDPSLGTMAILDRYKSVAAQNISPALTRAAWLEAGHLALARLSLGDAPQTDEGGAATPPENTDPEALARAGEEAFTNVVKLAGSDFTALGRALVGLGVLAEDRSEMDKAREWYQRVLDDKRLAGTPFQTEARFRIENLDKWSGRVAFSDAPPAATTPPASGDGKLTPIDPSDLPASFRNLPPQLSPTQPTPSPGSPTMAAQTQPASTPIKLEPIDPANLPAGISTAGPGSQPPKPTAGKAEPTTEPAASDSDASDQ